MPPSTQPLFKYCIMPTLNDQHHFTGRTSGFSNKEITQRHRIIISVWMVRGRGHDSGLFRQFAAEDDFFVFIVNQKLCAEQSTIFIHSPFKWD